MKATITVTLSTLALIFSVCTNSPTNPDQFQSSNQLMLYRGGDDLAQIESYPPTGTQYGTGNSTWTASGDEYLQDGYWVKNIYSNEYEIDVFESTLITLENRSTFSVTNPTGVKYKHRIYGWISLTSSGFITTDSLKTSSVGCCTIATDNDLDLETDGDNV